jgi:DTW domain-containing protein YfiP
MTNRRASFKKRCQKCLVHRPYCFCEKVSPLDNKTDVHIIMHKSESILTSNSARLSAMCLTNCSIHFRGDKQERLDLSFINQQNYQPLYLYPSDGSVELSQELMSTLNKPIQLIVPDGTWRQTKNIYRREPLLQKVPRVHLSPKVRSMYQLRRQKYDYGLCTHEAISYALGIIENENIEKNLLASLEIMVHAHLQARPLA